MLKTYPADVRVVFKHFPLQFHKYARAASTAAMAAHEQGKFWQYHDKVFENFNRLDEEMLMGFAAELELDMERFRKAYDDPDTQRLIERDMLEGLGAGVRGTPTVYVNGKLLGQRSFEGFKAAVEAELEKKKK